MQKRETAKQDELITKKLKLLMNSNPINLDNNKLSFNQKEQDFLHPDSQNTNKQEVINHLKIENKQLREELEGLKSQCLNLSSKFAEQSEILHSLQIVNIRLQNKFLCTEKTSCGGKIINFYLKLLICKC